MTEVDIDFAPSGAAPRAPTPLSTNLSSLINLGDSLMKMRPRSIFTSMAAAFALLAGAAAAAPAPDAKPTIVLVHGAFADASSWTGVISRLTADGYPVIAAANPLRSVSGDAAAISSLVASIGGPVVLVGHSYGGAVISAAANGHPNVKALVYVSAFAPEAGETSLGLSSLNPGSTLGNTLAPPVALPQGGHDLYIVQARFPAQFAADVPGPQAAVMAATQRPVTDTALNEPSGAPAWKTVPSYSIFGDADRNIPPATLRFMAERAHARRTVSVAGASHVVMVSHPAEVATLIEEAAHEAAVR